MGALPRPFHLVHLPLIVAGHVSVHLPSLTRREMQVYPHVVDWSAAAYDRRLLAGVDLVATSDAVRGRFESDTSRFREQARFYGLLDALCDRTAVFESGHGVSGPTIVIYRLTTQAREAVLSLGPLDTLWWTRTIPDSFKAAAQRELRAGDIRPAEVVPGLPDWVQPLRLAYSERYRFAANDLAENLASLDRLEPAERLGAAGLTVLPEDAWALEVYSFVAGALEDWSQLERRLARSIRVLSRHGPVPAHLLLRHGDVLIRLGDIDGAKEVLLSALASGDPIAADIARERLHALPPSTP